MSPVSTICFQLFFVKLECFSSFLLKFQSTGVSVRVMQRKKTSHVASVSKYIHKYGDAVGVKKVVGGK